MKPWIVRRVVDPASGDVLSEAVPTPVRRVISAETAGAGLRAGSRGWSPTPTAPASGPGSRAGGWPGRPAPPRRPTRSPAATRPTSASRSFVGFAPADAPRVVIGVFIDEPKGEVYGGEVAAPVFRELAEHALKARGVPHHRRRAGRRWLPRPRPRRGRRLPTGTRACALPTVEVAPAGRPRARARWPSRRSRGSRPGRPSAGSSRPTWPGTSGEAAGSPARFPAPARWWSAGRGSASRWRRRVDPRGIRRQKAAPDIAPGYAPGRRREGRERCGCPAVIEGTGASLGQAPDAEVSLVTADSREVKPGALFVAVPGARADGAAFAAGGRPGRARWRCSPSGPSTARRRRCCSSPRRAARWRSPRPTSTAARASGSRSAASPAPTARPPSPTSSRPAPRPPASPPASIGTVTVRAARAHAAPPRTPRPTPPSSRRSSPRWWTPARAWPSSRSPPTPSTRSGWPGSPSAPPASPT